MWKHCKHFNSLDQREYLITLKGAAIANGIVFAKIAKHQDVILTKRKLTSLDEYKKQGFSVTTDPKQATKVYLHPN
jgi:hypothetical protein